MTKNYLFLLLVILPCLTAVAHAADPEPRDTGQAAIGKLCHRADYYHSDTKLGDRCREVTNGHKFQAEAVTVCANMYHHRTEILVPCLQEISDKIYDKKDLAACELIAGSDRTEGVRCLNVYNKAAAIDKLCPAASSATKRAAEVPQHNPAAGQH